MKRGIVVLGWNRPEFLYTTLKGVFNVRNIEDISVFVSIDGGIDLDMRNKIEEVSKEFNITDLNFFDEQQGLLLAVTKGIYNTFMKGMDEVLYLEDDILMHPDLVNYWANYKLLDSDTFLNFTGDHECRDKHHYRSITNAIRIEKFMPLYDFVLKEKYVGGYNAPRDLIITKERGMNTHDMIYDYYCRVVNTVTAFSNRNYVFHYGVKGLHQRDSLKAREVYDRIYSGDKTQWFDNLIEFVSEHNFPDGIALIPATFRWNVLPAPDIDLSSKACFGPVFLRKVLDVLPAKSKILELGSGAGTKALKVYYNVTSIEQDAKYASPQENIYHAPKINGWYDVNVVANIALREYDCLIIDGPSGGGRMNILKHLNIFNTDKMIFVDDMHRSEEMELFKILSRDRKSEICDSNYDRKFGVIYPK